MAKKAGQTLRTSGAIDERPDGRAGRTSGSRKEAWRKRIGGETLSPAKQAALRGPSGSR